MLSSGVRGLLKGKKGDIQAMWLNILTGVLCIIACESIWHLMLSGGWNR